MTKESQEFVFLLLADLGAYHDGPAWHICTQRGCPRVVNRFHALSFGLLH
jgi:hypothetical protein